MALRSRIVLAAADGSNNQQIAAALRIARYDSPDPFGPRWIYEIKPEGDQKTPDQKDIEAPPTEK